MDPDVNVQGLFEVRFEVDRFVFHPIFYDSNSPSTWTKPRSLACGDPRVKLTDTCTLQKLQELMDDSYKPARTRDRKCPCWHFLKPHAGRCQHLPTRYQIYEAFRIENIFSWLPYYRRRTGVRRTSALKPLAWSRASSAALHEGLLNQHVPVV